MQRNENRFYKKRPRVYAPLNVNDKLFEVVNEAKHLGV